MLGGLGSVGAGGEAAAESVGACLVELGALLGVLGAGIGCGLYAGGDAGFGGCGEAGGEVVVSVAGDQHGDAPGWWLGCRPSGLGGRAGGQVGDMSVKRA